MDSVEKNIEKVKKITKEAFSPTFCFAKWYHTTLYLQTGETHSCYHPAPHKISLEDIKVNPSALHNTAVKKKERKEMLAGIQCNGCRYCWNIENMGDSYISDRHIRSASIYNEDRLHEIRFQPWDFDVDPEYIEISFGNECNFKCGYCHPKASSRYYNEIEQHGPYSMVKNHRCDIDWMEIYKEEDNPYLEAWWKWWPKVSTNLNILRITGGEPTIQTSTYKLLQSLEEDPKPKLELNVNSNLGGKEKQLEKFTKSVNSLIMQKKIKSFKLFTSMDTWGPRAEYIRDGLDVEVFEKNLDYFLTNTSAPITFMITFNIFSVTSFKLLLEKILLWRERYNNIDSGRWQRIHFDTPYLKEPLQYDFLILPKADFVSYFDDNLEFISQNISADDKVGFSNLEYEKFRRVVDYFKNTEYSDKKVTEGRKDFYNFFKEYDIRRNKNLIATFPEMENFFNLCKKTYES